MELSFSQEIINSIINAGRVQERCEIIKMRIVDMEQKRLSQSEKCPKIKPTKNQGGLLSLSLSLSLEGEDREGGQRGNPMASY